MVNTEIMVDNNTISLTNLDKILWPDKNYTKSELIKYYLDIAPYLIKYLKNRPLVVTRYPNGIEEKFFYQKNAPNHTPNWIKKYAIYSNESKRYINFILVEKASDLVWLANQACIELHPWLSTTDYLDYPDNIVFDIDPSPNNSYEQVVQVALVFKKLLDSLNLRSYIKTSGATGLHIYLPVVAKYNYETIRVFAHYVAKIVSEVLPDIATIERKVNQRGNKIYVDYLQNVKGKTICSVYSVRPRPNAPVSTPIKWSDIDLINPKDFNIKTIINNIETTDKLFCEILTDKQNIDNAAKQLDLNLHQKLH